MRRSGRRNTQKASTVLNMGAADLRDMSRADLAKTVSVLASAANKRIDRADRAGQPMSDSVDRFSVAGKSKAELIREFARAKEFMGNKRMSLSGQKEIAEGTVSGLAKAITGKQGGKAYAEEKRRLREVLRSKGGTKTPENDTFWRTYERLRESNPAIGENKRLKYKVLGKQVQIIRQNPGIDINRLHDRMEQEMQKIYEQEQERMQEETPTDVFDM